MNNKKTFGETVKSLREVRRLTLKDVSSKLDIDISTLGKIEKNQRSASKELIAKISQFFNVDEKQLHIDFLSDKVAYQLEDERYATEVLRVAEAKVKYLKQKDSNEAH
ncbi:helix-turn-helix domain-containing protein [Poritiphilus flavus]|uniref:Helix-turn-helix domain-containing protein n=1 Tax=Poritiphilus flavus TaxID=2697053 RepID=A0A6L9EG89_9FLAO|nr:helix-turn-helix transcriptional regulator [Poritiphilus flavus]NAS13676.1 helix-turn-helix domain-containing protein [Poritiphilus flavus]